MTHRGSSPQRGRRAGPRDADRLERSADLNLGLLGRFELRVGGCLLLDATWPHRKANAVLKILALEPTRHLHREQLLETLWPGKSPSAASNSFRQNIHHLRSHLTRHGVTAPVLVMSRDTVGLSQEIRTDIDAFRSAARAARRVRLDADLYQVALAIYAGDLLPDDLHEEWSVQPREELRALRCQLLKELACAHEARDQRDEAVHALEEVLRTDPLDEEAHRALIQLYVSFGDRWRAARQYKTCRRLLEEELGVEPSSETEAVYRRVLQGTAPGSAGPPAMSDLDSQPDPRRSGPGARTNLPARLTSFVGREREMAEVKELLLSAPLLTLTGPGGCGKTRLALEVAAALLQQFADGIWLVDLSALADPTRVAGALAETLGVSETPQRPLLMTLVSYLEPRELLLLLDNCEHLVAACAEFADTVITSCPRLRLLATSREALHVPAEVTWIVPPLSLPESEARVAPEELPRYEATQLFLERAKAASSRFSPGHGDASAVSRLCRRLDGIPLAIELAAAMVSVLTPTEIAERLDDRFELLTAGGRTTPPRHQTLRGTLDWSYDLLSRKDRVLFRRLAVFPGGFTLKAAEAVCAADEITSGEVLPTIRRLVAKSLVMSEAGADHETRFRLLETVRQYALQRLAESEDAARIQRAHADAYLALVEQMELFFSSPRHAEVLDRLESEHENIRAALTWCLQAGEAEKALRFAGSLAQFWLLRGYGMEGQRWLEQALAAGQEKPSPACAKALLHSASLSAVVGGQWQRGEALCQDSAEMFRLLGDKRGIAAAIGNRAILAQFQGDYERSVPFAHESVGLFRELGAKWGCAMGAGFLGSIDLSVGRKEEGTALLEEGVAGLRELGDKRGSALLLSRWGSLAQRNGDRQRAQGLCAEALALFRDIGDRPSIAGCLTLLGIVAGSLGQWRKAVRLFGAAETIHEAIHFRLLPDDRPAYECSLAAARAHLGQRGFSEAWTAGQAMEIQEATDYALAAAGPATHRPARDASL